MFRFYFNLSADPTYNRWKFNVLCIRRCMYIATMDCNFEYQINYLVLVFECLKYQTLSERDKREVYYRLKETPLFGEDSSI